jgi:recombination protein RecT
VQSITAHVVYKADKFKLVQGLEEKLEHEPNLEVLHKDEDIVGAYMIARFKSGGHHVEYMNIQEIMAIKKRSKAGDSGPWRSDFSEMVRKTVVRRGCKYLPLSIDAARNRPS